MRRRIAESVLELVQGDITMQSVDAIVNAANSRLAIGGGVDGAIHRAAGPSVIEELSERYPDGCPAGAAVASGAGKLAAKYVIHAVGPVWQGGRKGEPELLRSAYESSLQLAVEHQCQSIAFPAISTGIYGYPMDQAAYESLRTTIEFLRGLETPLHVRFLLHSSGAYGAFMHTLDELLPS